MTASDTTVAAGPATFARFACAPNRLGYCGPAHSAALHDGSESEIRAAARQFSGAWPYLQALARLTGIADPLDIRLVESYWLGGGVGAMVDAAAFTAELLAAIGPDAGRYWAHLNAGLVHEAAANHSFHVFGVYPWSRLLRAPQAGAQALAVLDNCRISWATVLERDGDAIRVRGPRLRFTGTALSLSEPVTRTVPVQVEPMTRAEQVDGYVSVPAVGPGDRVAVHWDQLCGRLAPQQLQDLRASTQQQLAVTNQRLGG